MTKLKLLWNGQDGPDGSNFFTPGVDIGSVLPALFEGLIETKHPLSFIAQQGIKDLLGTAVCVFKKMARKVVIPLLKKLLHAVRPCFDSPEQSVYLAALSAIR